MLAKGKKTEEDDQRQVDGLSHSGDGYIGRRYER